MAELKAGRLKIQLAWSGDLVVYQVLEQVGLPAQKYDGFVHIVSFPALSADCIFLRGESKDWDQTGATYRPGRSDYVDWIVGCISEELFNGKQPSVAGSEYTWQD